MLHEKVRRHSAKQVNTVLCGGAESYLGNQELDSERLLSRPQSKFHDKTFDTLEHKLSTFQTPLHRHVLPISYTLSANYSQRVFNQTISTEIPARKSLKGSYLWGLLVHDRPDAFLSPNQRRQNIERSHDRFSLETARTSANRVSVYSVV